MAEQAQDETLSGAMERVSVDDNAGSDQPSCVTDGNLTGDSPSEQLVPDEESHRSGTAPECVREEDDRKDNPADSVPPELSVDANWLSPLVQPALDAWRDDHHADGVSDTLMNIIDCGQESQDAAGVGALSPCPSDGVDGDHAESWTLLSLPGELLLKIFDYLDARLVLGVVSLVCKTFNEVVSKNVEWKVRFRRRWKGTFPVVPVDDDDFDWKRACIEREEAYHRWARREAGMDHFSLSMAHIAAIDCVHLMNNAELCVTGARDRTFQMWDLRKLDINNPESSVKEAMTKNVKGHKGWVWDITSLGHHMCTASWDCWLKIWDINSDLKLVNEFKGRSAFLSVVYNPDVIIAGAYDKSIYIFDPRVDGNGQVYQLKHHKKPVLTVAADENYIISGSEDKTIAIYDRRADRLYKKLELQSFCMSMSYQYGELWTGQRDGNVHVIDPSHGDFDIIQSYDVGHKGKITDVIYTAGALYTCSTDTTLRITEPSHNPQTMCKITAHTKDLTAIDLQGGVLASASSDLTAGIWRPKTVDS